MVVPPLPPLLPLPLVAALLVMDCLVFSERPSYTAPLTDCTAHIATVRTYPLADPQHRHHRPRRPWEDHIGGPDAPPGGGVPRQPAADRAGARLEPVGAGAGHHDPFQEHRGTLG